MLVFAFALAAGLGFSSKPVQAQPRFHHVTVEDGLPQSSVLSITMDTRGFLWFGTYDGLVRYDGYEYRTYHADSGRPETISDGNIRAVLPDGDGALWVGTKSGGLNFFDARRDRFVRYRHDPDTPQSLPHDEVRALCRDQAGTIWVGTFGGLASLDPAGGTFVTYRQAGAGTLERAADEILALAAGPDGVLFVGTNAGLFRFDPRTMAFSPMALDPGPESSPGGGNPMIVSSLYAADGRTLFAGTEWQGLFEIDLESGRITRHLEGRAIAATFRDSRGTLWVGTDVGLAQRESPEKPFVMHVHEAGDPLSLCGNDIRCVMEDASGILWFGSFTAGISKLSPKTRAFDLYRKKTGDPRGLSGGEVSAVTMDSRGRLWVGTRDGGITVIDRRTGGRKVFRHDPDDPGSISQDEITCLLRDRFGRVWAGTADKGLNLFDEAGGTWRHFRHDPDNPESLSQDKVWYVAETRDGMLWVGTSKGGLNRLDPATGACRRYRHDPGDPKSISHDRVRHIVEAHNGGLWIGTNKGLNLFDRATETFRHWENDPDNPHSLSNDRVTPILEMPNGLLWVGTDSGLNRFDPRTGTFTRYTKADGLQNDGIQAILRDETGALWMSTFKGLSRFDPVAGEFRNYTAKDGLQGVEFWINAAYRDAYTGEMFFGGIKGLNGFFPKEVEKNSHAPPVVVTALSITDRPYTGETATDFVGEIELSPGDRGFTVTYAALDFADPAKNHYSHILEGFDHDWTKPSPRRFATYTNLDPGVYALRMRAANDDGIWNDAGTTLRIRVLPPYWETTWFRGLFLAVVLGSAWFFYRWRVARVERKRLELAAVVDERTLALRREIEERKGAEERLREAKFVAEQAATAKSEFLARMSHEIRTPINIIMGMADLLSESGLSPRQSRYVSSFQSAGELLLSIINDILDFSKIEAGKIELERTTFSLGDELRRVADLAAFRASGKGLGFSWSVAGNVPDHVLGDPARLRQVLMNLLGNALKFTVSGEVRLAVERGDDAAGMASPAPGEAFTARFSIRDTGIGIPEKVLEDIFERFSQADVSTSRRYGGTGLGLAICRKLVELMGGTIAVTSREGQGSEFTFTAALQAAPRGAVPEPFRRLEGGDLFPSAASMSVDVPAGEPAFDGSGVGILLAEDNEANRNVVRLFLAECPARIEVAENGVQAVALFREKPFDLVLMDVEMPGMDGLAATQTIREIEKQTGRSPVPVIALTAHAFQEHRRQCLEAGCTDFVTKPVGKARLIQVLDTHLPGRGFGRDKARPGPPVRPAKDREPAGGQGDTTRIAGHAVVIKERLRPIVPVFMRTARQGLDDMRQGVARGDLEAVRRGGHSLKGSGATMGFAYLAAVGRDIERAASEGDTDRVSELLDAFERYLADLDVRFE
ncbi:hybrid sensor histidine kinase/response regulator [Desulfolutivibrio sulfoxidireducens]|uniref:hybrid sensor histidine kinase/response regulator n=1 Tax=Desulfolutivibrio sulfoxidireducens TaxID=2773299 RepID=UPI00159E2A3C|nr:hybrid sensor histidine kinase/response regulator [Desulfolutivibrio sulfoxidireducens]QLA21142.1 response regulator [Desulfolutivibrio sulfoxidireducens]